MFCKHCMSDSMHNILYQLVFRNRARNAKLAFMEWPRIRLFTNIVSREGRNWNSKNCTVTLLNSSSHSSSIIGCIILEYEVLALPKTQLELYIVLLQYHRSRRRIKSAAIETSANLEGKYLTVTIDLLACQSRIETITIFNNEFYIICVLFLDKFSACNTSTYTVWQLKPRKRLTCKFLSMIKNHR